MRVLQGFRDFLFRGNVIDLAVGIVIGAAFTALVASFTNSFIQPLIKLLGGGGQLGGSFVINGVEFTWAAFVNGVITFVITAAALYFFVVLPITRWSERRRKRLAADAVDEADLSDEAKLLKEILDTLRQQATPR